MSRESIPRQEDPHAILGVGYNATDKEINDAYRGLALRFHPDRNPDDKEGAEENFRKITEARNLLLNKDVNRGSAGEAPIQEDKTSPVSEIVTEFRGKLDRVQAQLRREIEEEEAADRARPPKERFLEILGDYQKALTSFQSAAEQGRMSDDEMKRYTEVLEELAHKLPRVGFTF
jgi:curved DNA-binding protein CbpA